MGSVFPKQEAIKAAELFLTPRRLPARQWEKIPEEKCDRTGFGDGLSAARWGRGSKKVLLMHGWESRATQMYNFVPGLVDLGFEVIGIDAPGHGRSKPGKAHPVAFSKSICSADKKFGTVYAAIGHSMGAAAISIAMEAGVEFQKVVLISSPSRMYDVLMLFAQFIGLPSKAASFFVKAVEDEVGRRAADLHVTKVFENLKPRALVIHSKNDSQVPFKNHTRIMNACPDFESLTPDHLGHRRIVRDKNTALAMTQFLKDDK